MAKPDIPALWTFDEAYAHLKMTFEMEFNRCPDILEAYVILLDGEDDPRVRMSVMQRALRETIRKRFPLTNERTDNG